MNPILALQCMLVKTVRLRNKATYGRVHLRCQSCFLHPQSDGRGIVEIKILCEGKSKYIVSKIKIYRLADLVSRVFFLLHQRSGHERLLKVNWNYKYFRPPVELRTPTDKHLARSKCLCFTSAHFYVTLTLDSHSFRQAVRTRGLWVRDSELASLCAYLKIYVRAASPRWP